MRTRSLRSWSCVLFPLLWACTASSEPLAGVGDGVDASLPEDPDPAGRDAGAAPRDPEPYDEDAFCSEEVAAYVYVFSADELWRFEPVSAALERVGALDCPTNAEAFLDMPVVAAIRRTGSALVAFRESGWFDVDLTTAACTATQWSGAAWQGTVEVSTASFAADAPGSGEETLYGSVPWGFDFGSFATETMAFTSAGAIVLGEDAAIFLAGSAAGDLWAHAHSTWDEAPDAIATVDKTSGAVLAQTPITLPAASMEIGGETYTASVEGLAFWGGRLWMFQQTPIGARILSYTPGAGAAELVTETRLLRPIGAGSSTCAPLEGPW